MKREELLAEARKHMWAAWQLSSEELASQAAETLIGLGMLVPEGGAQDLEKLRARVAELEQAAEEIRFLHKDSPMGPCPVCVDADAWARGDDPTVPYPCPTARLAGAKDCDPPSADAISRRIAPTQALREPEPQPDAP